MMPRGRITERSARRGTAMIARCYPCLILTYAAVAVVTVLVLWPSWSSTTVLIRRNRNNHSSDPSSWFRPRLSRIRNATLDDDTRRAEKVSEMEDQQQQQQQQRVWDILRAAGVSTETLQQHAAQLPTWSSIVQQYGEHPVILGAVAAAPSARQRHNTATTTTAASSSSLAETCRTYRDRVPAARRMLGAAGMFSTGTNLVTQLLKHNCYIPERYQLYGPSATKEQLGIRWQVRE
jgi:hypothetical protein